VDVALQFEEDPYSAARGYAPWQTVVKDVRRTCFSLSSASATS
jgi:hypothetical protein